MLVDVVIPAYAVPLWERVAGRRCFRWALEYQGGPLWRAGIVLETDECLNRALDALTAVNEMAIAMENIPPMHRCAIRYELEVGEQLRYAGEVYATGWGDCDDLATWRAAEHRRNGVHAVAVSVPSTDGPTPAHVVVRLPNGRIEDPSQEYIR